jgi:hypothetical protein
LQCGRKHGIREHPDQGAREGISKHLRSLHGRRQPRNGGLELRVVTFIPDAAGQTFTFVPENDVQILGVFATLGRALVGTDPQATIATVFSFPPAKVQVTDLLVATEKVFIPVVFQLNRGNSIFITLESAGPFMLFLEDLPSLSAE